MEQNEIEKIGLAEIILEHPSICYTCEHSRKSASNENTKNGYVGCCLRVIGFDHDQILSAKEIAEGWVDLRSVPSLDEGSGIISNYQLLTLEVNNCKKYSEKN